MVLFPVDIYLDHIYHTDVAFLLCGPLCDDGRLLTQ